MLKRRYLLALATTLSLGAPFLPASAAPRAATLDPGVASIFARARAVMGTDRDRQPRALHAVAEMRVFGLRGTVDMRKSGRNLRFETVIGPTHELVVFRGEEMYQRDSTGLVAHATDNDLMQNLTMASLSNYTVLAHPENGQRYWHTPLGSKAPQPLRWVKVQTANNPTQYYGFDPKNGYLTEIVIERQQNQISIYLHDYRKVQRQEIPYRFELSDAQHRLVGATLTRVDVSAKPNAADFAVPTALRVYAPRPYKAALVRESGHRFFLPVTIAGQHFLMHLDSASRNTIIDERVAAQLHLDVDRPQAVAGLPNALHGGYATLPGFAVGAAHFPEERVVVGNLGKTAGGHAIDGIMGFPFFAQAALVLDPHDATLLIARPGTSLPGRSVAGTYGREFIDLTAALSGGPHDAHLVIATGRADGITFNRSFYEANLKILVAGTPHTYVGGSLPALTAVLKGLHIEGLPPYQNLPVHVRYADSPWSADAGVSGSIGMDFLQGYRLSVDVQNSVLRFEPVPVSITPPTVSSPQPSATPSTAPSPSASLAPGPDLLDNNAALVSGKHHHHRRESEAQSEASPQPQSAASAVPGPSLSPVTSPAPQSTAEPTSAPTSAAGPTSVPAPNSSAAPVAGTPAPQTQSELNGPDAASSIDYRRHRHHHGNQTPASPLPTLTPSPALSDVPSISPSPFTAPTPNVLTTPQATPTPQPSPTAHASPAPHRSPAPHAASAHGHAKSAAHSGRKPAPHFAQRQAKAQTRRQGEHKRPVAGPTPAPKGVSNPPAVLKLKPAAASWRARHGPWHPNHPATPKRVTPAKNVHPTPAPRSAPAPHVHQTPKAKLKPTPRPSAAAHAHPTPSRHATAAPLSTASPSAQPSAMPSAEPSPQLSSQPSAQPDFTPSALPSPIPTAS